MSKDDGAEKQSNVIPVPPRRKMITHKGLHGWIEWRPSVKRWGYTCKLKYIVPLGGEALSEAEAEFELKKLLDIALSKPVKNIGTVD